MRIQTLLVPLALGLCVAGCKRDTTEAAGSPGASPATGGYSSTATHKGAPFPTEVVAIEQDRSGVTLRELAVGPTGVKEQRVVRVDPNTKAAVAALKPGDRVRIVCEEPAGTAPASGGQTSAVALQNCAMVVEAAAETSK